jgi:hypothetical protein
VHQLQHSNPQRDDKYTTQMKACCSTVARPAPALQHCCQTLAKAKKHAPLYYHMYNTLRFTPEGIVCGGEMTTAIAPAPYKHVTNSLLRGQKTRT